MGGREFFLAGSVLCRPFSTVDSTKQHREDFKICNVGDFDGLHFSGCKNIVVLLTEREDLCPEQEESLGSSARNTNCSL